MTENANVSYSASAVNRWSCPLPLVAWRIPAGFPSPAEDYIEGEIDLNEQLIQHPHSTFLMKVSGDSMIGAGIMPGSTLVVDKSLEARHGSVVIAVIDGQLTVKRLFKKSDVVQLRSENPAYKPIKISKEQDLVIWGVVTNVINQLAQ